MPQYVETTRQSARRREFLVFAVDNLRIVATLWRVAPAGLYSSHGRSLSKPTGAITRVRGKADEHSHEQQWRRRPPHCPSSPVGEGPPVLFEKENVAVPLG
jgi:hypothetical protein